MYKTLKELKRNQHCLSPQQYKTIKGQILAGDVMGGRKGLIKLLRKGGKYKWNG